MWTAAYEMAVRCGAYVAGMSDRGPRDDVLAGVVVLLVDVAIPVALFYALRAAAVDQVAALLLSGVPPAIRLGAALIRHRALDKLGLIVLVSLGLSALAVVWSDDPRSMLVRNALIGLPIAVWMLLSIRASRPLTYEVGTSLLPSRTREMERAWSASASFRRVFRRLAVAWGIGGIANVAAGLAIALTLPVDTVPGLDAAILIVGTVVLSGFTLLSLVRTGATRLVFAQSV
jgi:hypothetical protein